MLRVLMVTTSFPRHSEDVAGAFLLPLARMLAEETQLEVLAPHHPGRLEPLDGIHVSRFRYALTTEKLFYGAGAPVNLRTGGRARIQAAGALASMTLHIRRRRPDVVFAHWLIPGALAGVLSGIPTVAYAHGSDVRLLKHCPPLMRMIAARALVVAPTATLARELPVGASVLPLPVDEALDAAPLGRFDVGYLGRLIAQKGVGQLIRAAAISRRHLVIAGDGPERAALESLARALNAEVTFLGWIPPSARGRLFASVRVMAVPSVEAEGSPAVIAEAQAAGVPVVGFAVPGVAEGLHERAMTTVGDVDGLARLLVQAGEDALWRTETLAHGRDAVASRLPRMLAPSYMHLLHAAATRSSHG